MKEHWPVKTKIRTNKSSNLLMYLGIQRDKCDAKGDKNHVQTDKCDVSKIT